MNDDEENSECSVGCFMHDYQIVASFPTGVVERCSRCNDEQFFHTRVPNKYYLSFHLRSRLRPSDVRFNKEYNE